MKLFRSIRWRLQLWYGLLIGALLLAFAVTAYEVEKATRLDRVDDELARLVFNLNSANRGPPVPRGTKGGPRPPAAEKASPGDRPPPADDAARERRRDRLLTFSETEMARGFYFAVWLKNGEPFTASPNAPIDLPKPVHEKTGTEFRQRGSYREAFVMPQPDDYFLVGRSFAGEQLEIDRMAWKLAGGGATIFLLALLIGWWLVTRALRPIHDISGAAQKIATGDLSQRINTRDAESELGQLAGVLNSTFSRLEASFAQQARFTADAAHELRTPVSVMLTHAQNGLASDELTPEQREAFEACQRAAQRMRRLIDALLELSRLDAGQETMTLAPLDLSAVAADCVALVQPLAAKRRITVQTELTAAECTGDATRVEQVITNLLANAIHHNTDGGEVCVRTGQENGTAFVVVADDGPGIAAEHLPHIFKRFFRADKARSATGRTGLGLAITHAIVEAHGGQISVASEVGQGAVFTVRLPRR